MKKITSLLMAALMLCSMLSVFAVPAFAQEKQDDNMLDPSSASNLCEKGQWVEAPATCTVPEGKTLYQYIIDVNTERIVSYTVAYYVYYKDAYGIEKAKKTTTGSVTGNNITAVLSPDEVPECVREAAKNDYGDFNSTGSVLAAGNIIIIIAAAVVAVGGIFALVIVKKKKKTA